MCNVETMFLRGPWRLWNWSLSVSLVNVVGLENYFHQWKPLFAITKLVHPH